MATSFPDALVLTRQVLRVLRLLNPIVGVLILSLLVARIISETAVMGALGAHPEPGSAMRFLGMRLIMIMGIGAVSVVHVVLTRLLAIVDSVAVGNAFELINAHRLTVIAWAVLGLELLHFAIGVVAAMASTAAAPLDISWGLSVTRWLAVLLFVLARVFEQGARMRDDLEGTV